MSKIHFLNVLEGDCNIIEHDSGRVTIIDVSNASNDIQTIQEQIVRASAARAEMLQRTKVPVGKKDYYQKKEPDNPISYLKNLNVQSIFRFIITHPDMDHLDGIRDLYEDFTITNTWDTNNTKTCDMANFGGGYNPEDWIFYERLRNGKFTDTKRMTIYSAQSRDYWNADNIHVLAPTPELLKYANEVEDWNDSSYVLLYTPPKQGGGYWKILFAGDSHDRSWDYIIRNYSEVVKNVDVLMAPHHGRDSGRNYDFLNILKPKVTLFGNASSQHLAYSQYPEIRITNNQAGIL